MGGVETPTTQPTNETGGGGTIKVQKSGNVVQLLLFGKFKNINGGTYTTICTLPDGYKPSIDTIMESVSYSSTPSGKSFKYLIRITTSGLVSVALYYSDSTPTPTPVTEIYISQNIIFLTNN